MRSLDGLTARTALMRAFIESICDCCSSTDSDCCGAAVGCAARLSLKRKPHTAQSEPHRPKVQALNLLGEIKMAAIIAAEKIRILTAPTDEPLMPVKSWKHISWLSQ